MRSVVCFGEALIDFVAEPAQQGRPRAFFQHAGGAPANVAVAVARLGGEVQFVGMLGQDMFGDFLLGSLSGMGVGTAHVHRTDRAPTALAFVSLDAQGERSFSFYRPPAADLLFGDEDFDPALFASASVFHACSNSLTESAIAQTTLSGMRRAQAAGALVSFDMNLRPALWGEGVDPAPRIRSALALADVVKFSVEEFAFLAAGAAENAVLESLWQGRARLVVVTDGAAPLRWHTRERCGAVPTFPVRVLDTNAAGDAFVGGLLFRLAEQAITPHNVSDLLGDADALASTLRFAAACGALATTRSGAFSAMPARACVETLLATP
jgi:fructokinase